MHDPSVADIQAGGEVLVVIESRHALRSELDHEGQRRIVERLRRGHGHCPRHVRHAIMDNVIDLEGRLFMRGRPRGLEAAALIDRDIHQNRTALHAGKHVAGDELRRAGAGNQHRADHHVGAEHFGLDAFHGRGERAHATLE